MWTNRCCALLCRSTLRGKYTGVQELLTAPRSLLLSRSLGSRHAMLTSSRVSKDNQPGAGAFSSGWTRSLQPADSKADTLFHGYPGCRDDCSAQAIARGTPLAIDQDWLSEYCRQALLTRVNCVMSNFVRRQYRAWICS